MGPIFGPLFGAHFGAHGFRFSRGMRPTRKNVFLRSGWLISGYKFLFSKSDVIFPGRETCRLCRMPRCVEFDTKTCRITCRRFTPFFHFRKVQLLPSARQAESQFWKSVAEISELIWDLQVVPGRSFRRRARAPGPGSPRRRLSGPLWLRRAAQEARVGSRPARVR